MTENQIDKTTGYLILSHNGAYEAISPETKSKFLELMTQRWNLGVACKQLGLNRDSIYRHLELDDKFKQDYIALLEDVNDLHENTISDASLKSKNFVASIAWLKAHRPNKWREKTVIQQIDHNNDDKLKLLLKLAESWPVQVVPQAPKLDAEVISESMIPSERKIVPNTPIVEDDK